MQLLIDTATETPKSLLVASRILSILSAEMHLLAHPADDHVASINGGDGGEITLTTTETHTVGDMSHTVSSTVHSGPAPLNATFAVPEVSAEFDAHMALPTRPDPSVVFGRFGASVPAGTNVDPPLAGIATKDAPPAPVDSEASAPPAPTAAQTTALPATTTAAAGAILPAPTGDRDSKGIPWDARVHSDTRKTNADGTWRFRRNLDELTKASVMAELKNFARIPSALEAPAAPPAPGAPPVPGSDVPSDTLPTAPDAPVTLPGTLPLPASANVGVPDAPNPPLVSAPITGFRDLMSKINIARSQGRLTQEQVDAACKAANVGSITELAAQPALVPSVNTQIDRYLGVAA